MSTSMHATPSMRAVLAEQVRFVGLAVRRDAAIGAALLAALLVIPFHDQPINFTRDIGVWFALLGLIAPFAIWKRLDGDGHLWTLPVEHRRLALTGVFAGWCWLMVAAAALLAWAALIVLRTDGELVSEQTRAVLKGSGPLADPLDPVRVSMVDWRTPAWYWVLPFTAATVTYLFGSAVMLCASSLRRWLGGAALILLLILLVGRGGGFGVLSALVTGLASHPYGLETVFAGGPMRQGLGQVLLTTGEKVFVWRSLPTIGGWLVATVIWFVLGLVALWVATVRYREDRVGARPAEQVTRP